MSGINWDQVSVGDVDCTDTGVPDELLCPEVYQQGRVEHFCSRVAGHDEPHVAGDGDEVLAVWP